MSRLGKERPIRRGAGGFSLVELLSIIMILAVLAAVAIPLYTSTRRSAAARTCKANIAALAAAQAAHALSKHAYNATPMNAFTATPPGLVGAPQGLANPITCPLGDADGNGVVDEYAITIGADKSLTIACPNAARHGAVLPPQSDYSRHMAAPGVESEP